MEFTDKQMIDWLESRATSSFDFETFSLNFAISESFEGSNTIREVIAHAMREDGEPY